MYLSWVTILSVNLGMGAVLLVLMVLYQSKLGSKILSNKSFLILCALVLLRCLIPVGLPFARRIPSQTVLPELYKILSFEWEVFDEKINVMQMLFWIWVTGFCFMICWRFQNYWKVRKLIDALPPVFETEISEIWSAICKRHRKLKGIKLVQLPYADSPVVLGVVSPVVVLPQIRFTKEEYTYILEHEASHIIGKDTIRKGCIDLICMIGWMSPLSYLLEHWIGHMIELENDQRVLKTIGQNFRREYANSLISVAEKLEKEKRVEALTFTKKNYRELKKRIKNIYSSNNHGKLMESLVLFAVVGAVIWLTSFILEPHEAPIQKSFSLSEDNCYFMQCGDAYDIFYKGDFLESVEDLTYYPDQIKLYKMREYEKTNAIRSTGTVYAMVQIGLEKDNGFLLNTPETWVYTVRNGEVYKKLYDYETRTWMSEAIKVKRM